MYSFMLQAAEERLRKKCTKASEEEVAPSSSAPAMNIDDPLPLAPSSASTSSHYTTTSPSRPSSPPSITAIASTPEEPLPSSPPPQNPNLPLAPTTSAGEGTSATTADAPTLFPISVGASSLASPTTPLNASFPLVSFLNLEAPFVDVGIPSISSTPPSQPSFFFETNIPSEDTLLFPMISQSPPVSPRSPRVKCLLLHLLYS